MRKFILFFTGGLIMLSVLFIFVNNFLASINDATYENERRDFYRKNTFFYIFGDLSTYSPEQNAVITKFTTNRKPKENT